MAHLKSFITRYSKVYIGLVSVDLDCFLLFFLGAARFWGGKIDLFSIQKVLLVFGILSILMALLSKKVSLFCFWIDLLFFSLD